MQRTPLSPEDVSLPLPEDEAAHHPHPPHLKELFLVWLRIGAFSFGGGAATLFLMRREFVQRRRWITGDQYNEAFALSKLTPGTNIIAQSIVMGKMMARAAWSPLSPDCWRPQSSSRPCFPFLSPSCRETGWRERYLRGSCPPLAG